MGGFIDGKGFMDDSINIKQKLDEQHHTTDMGDGKSLVNVEALKDEIGKANLGGATGNNVGQGVGVYKNKTASTLNLKSLKSLSNVLTIAGKDEEIEFNIDKSNFQNLLYEVLRGSKDTLCEIVSDCVGDPKPNSSLNVKITGKTNLELPENSTTLKATPTGENLDNPIYKWEKVSGGSANLSGENSSTLNLSNLKEGTYKFRVIVIDGDDKIAMDTVTVTVVPHVDRTNPTVDAGDDKTIKLPTDSVSVTATASDDSGTISSINWIKKSGGNATISGGDTLTPNFSDLEEGTYVFEVTVTDPTGNTSKDTVTITVEPADIVIYRNSRKQKTVSKNDCGPNETGSRVTYVVEAGKHTSEISQEDADRKAQADIDANAQSYANQNGTCDENDKWVNERRSRTFTKNDCSENENGSSVEYVVEAGTYESYESQADANQKADEDIDRNGQDYANTNGTCNENQKWGNERKAKTFTRNNCGPNEDGTAVEYVVEANTYESYISQADANRQATEDINSNGQEYANTNGRCIAKDLYRSDRMTRSFTKNNCPSGQVGSEVTYVVEEGKYTSYESKAEADRQAEEDLEQNGQSYANTNGTCREANEFYLDNLKGESSIDVTFDCEGEMTGNLNNSYIGVVSIKDGEEADSAWDVEVIEGSEWLEAQRRESSVSFNIIENE